jgi:hypothetical protein
LKASARQTIFSTCVVAELQSAVVAAVTVKSSVDVAVVLLVFTDTVILPVAAPAGTVTVSCVAVAAVTVAAVPLKATVLLAAVVLKFVPVMVTVVPSEPLAGVKLVMAGALVDVVVTVKSLVDVAATLFTVTTILPVVAPVGTVTVSCVAVAAVTVAAIPLKVTVLAEAVVLKFVPVIITVVPTTPLVGVKLVMVGDTVVVVSSSSLLQADTMHKHIIIAATLASTTIRVRIVFLLDLVMFI